MERTNIRDFRSSKKNDTSSSQSNNTTLFDRVLQENTALARTLAIREKSSTSTTMTPPSRYQKQQEDKSDVVMRVGGSVARARMVNNNLDWLCTKCRNHNFARVVVRCRSISVVLDTKTLTITRIQYRYAKNVVRQWIKVQSTLQVN